MAASMANDWICGTASLTIIPAILKSALWQFEGAGDKKLCGGRDLTELAAVQSEQAREMGHRAKTASEAQVATFPTL